MRTLTAPERPAPVDRRAARGRWIWTVSGLVTLAALCLPVALFITRPWDHGNGQLVSATATRTVTVIQPVSSLSVESYGAPIQITARPVRRVTVTEAISYDRQAGPAPAVTAAVSDGRLALDAPACASTDCSVGFTVTVPTGVTVTAEGDGGGITVAGVAAADLDSGGGPVRASGIDGPLTVSSEDGSVTVSGLTGDLQADTGGGPLSGDSLATPSASVTTDDGSAGLTFVTAPAYVLVDTGGGRAHLVFDRPPASVMVTTDDGSATLNVPGGPYSVTASSEGGSQTMDVPTAPDAKHSLTVNTGGGPLDIAPR